MSTERLQYEIARARARHEIASAHYREAATAVEAASMGVVRAEIIGRFPTATAYEVKGEFNEDSTPVLRIRRVLNADAGVLFDVDNPTDDETTDFVGELSMDYLDLVIDITGDEYMGEHEILLMEDA